MKKLFLVTILALACIHPFNWKLPRVFPAWVGPTQAWAADCKFSWKSVAGASGYSLEYSPDQGVTWTGKKTTGALTPDSNGDVSFTYTSVPETGLMLFRISATNASGSSTRTEYGAWYNHLWKPMDRPSGGGIMNQ